MMVSSLKAKFYEEWLKEYGYGYVFPKEQKAKCDTIAVLQYNATWKDVYTLKTSKETDKETKTQSKPKQYPFRATM